MALIEYFKRRSDEVSITDLMNEIIEKTGYIENLEAEDKEDAQARIENIEELVSKIAAYEEQCAAEQVKPSLSQF